ncbi:hypothetical protein LCGC14_2964570 [marine sediment metagenome]|uniref:N-acetylmuramoyl-L-alanine amidase n=1 Tax=marine sediment metagenome TaxID=412755 RepID=A0A0F8XYQ5_9ZZZZ
MRFPGAIWRGTNKHGYPNSDTHLQNGVVIHSAEGSFAGAMSVLDGPRQASWHFFVTKAGEVYQHVDTNDIAWTNGGFDANRLFWGIECEGVEGEPLTEPQFEALLGVVRWLWANHQVGAFVRQETAWEHREMTQFGSAPTSCPSGRIPWERLISELEPIEEEEMPKLIQLKGTQAIAVFNDVYKLQGLRSEFIAYFYPGLKVDQVSQADWDSIPDAHGGGSGAYTDKQAVKAVKDALPD